MSRIDVLVPTDNCAAALAATLTGRCAQTTGFDVSVSDQPEDHAANEVGEVQAVCRVLQARGHPVTFHRYLPRRGIAEQRQFLQEQATAPYVLYLDDDILLEPWVVQLLEGTLHTEGCGFVGLSFAGDVRPHEQAIAFWEGPVQPETVRPNTPPWERWQLHNAANLWHIQQAQSIIPEAPRGYTVAWAVGCILFDRAKLLDVGALAFGNTCRRATLAKM